MSASPTSSGVAVVAAASRAARPRGPKVLRIGILGAGVVAGGVVEMIKRQRPLFRAQRFDLVVARIASRSGVPRGFAPERGTLVTADVNDVLNDASLDVVVDAMGGAGEPAARALTATAAHLVTANKALLATRLPDVLRAFRRSGRQSRRLGFEAAVLGGVPVIRALAGSLAGDNVSSLAGVLNGTTNVVLTTMQAGGQSYDAALAGAQAAGFAEADPSADVDGVDAAHKLVLLTALATGLAVPMKAVRVQGIRAVTDWDFAALADAGRTVKLLGGMTVFDAPPPPPPPAAARDGATAEGGGAPAPAPAMPTPTPTPTPTPPARAPPARLPTRLLDLFVSPCVVPRAGSYGRTGGADNVLRVVGAASGPLTFSGAGAGRFPTASAVVADLVAIARGTAAAPPFPRPPPRRLGHALKPSPALCREWYVRGPAAAIELASLALWRQGVSCTPVGPAGGATKAFIARTLSAADVDALLRRLDAKEGPFAPGALVAWPWLEGDDVRPDAAPAAAPREPRAE